MSDIHITIDTEGHLRSVYDDELGELFRNMEARITRASHVEPDPSRFGYWFVDMTPVGGPVVAGFSKRQEALEWEMQWLIKNYL